MRAVDGLARLASGEEDDGGQREDAVATRDSEVFVDVQSDEAYTALVLRRNRAEVWLDRLARLAPRSPEVDDHRDRGGQHLCVERLVRDLDHRRSVVVRLRRPGDVERLELRAEDDPAVEDRGGVSQRLLAHDRRVEVRSDVRQDERSDSCLRGEQPG